MKKLFLLILVCLLFINSVPAQEMVLSDGTKIGNDVFKDFGDVSIKVIPEISKSLTNRHKQEVVITNKQKEDVYVFFDMYSKKVNVASPKLLTTVQINKTVEDCSVRTINGSCNLVNETIEVDKVVKTDLNREHKLWGNSNHFHTTRGMLVKPSEKISLEVDYEVSEKSGKWNARVWANTVDDWSCVVEGSCLYDVVLDPSWTQGTTGVELYYTHDAGNVSDPDVYDSSNQNDASAVATFGVPGIINDSLYFSGSNTYEVLDTDLIDLFDGGGSVSMWVKSDASQIKRLFDNRQAVVYRGYFLRTYNAKLRFTVDFSTSNGQWELTDSNFTNGEWVHVVIVYDKSSASNNPVIYVNGTKQGLTEIETPIGNYQDANHDFYIGNRDILDQDFAGYIDEIAIFSRELSSNEVDYLYNSGSPGEEQQYPFESDDSCTYGGSGNYDVTCDDACVWNSNFTVNGNLSLTGSGTITMNANITMNVSPYQKYVETGCTLYRTDGNNFLVS